MFGCQSEDRFIFTLIQFTSVHIMVFGVVTSLMMKLCLHSSSHVASNSIWSPMYLEEVVLTWIEKVAAKRQQNSVLFYTCRRNQPWQWENFITPNIWCPNSPNYHLLDYYLCGTVEQETNKTLCNTKDELKARIMAAFTNLNKETIIKACWRLVGYFWSRMEVKVEAMAIYLNKFNL